MLGRLAVGSDCPEMYCLTLLVSVLQQMCFESDPVP